MDCVCDYLLYSKAEEEEEEDEDDDDDDDNDEEEQCLHCLDFPIQEKQIRCTVTHNTPQMCFDEAMTGLMVQYVEVLEAPGLTNGTVCRSTPVRFVKHGRIWSLSGAIHMRDVSPNGTWLLEKTNCVQSLVRLRLAGLTCVRLPGLNRIVLEQKNDDGLLYLANKWLLSKENMNECIELFGPFACDAMLSPVLHKILRSHWIEERKEAGETNNELTLGWAQEFYDWTCVTKNRTGSTVFAHWPTCPAKALKVAHGYKVVTAILEKMRLCGFTPWSAVLAVRSSEASISKVACSHCMRRLLASCAFLVECAAVEASRQRDWLVRNEAVIQLCWLLHQMHHPEGCDANGMLEAWAESIVTHSIRFQQYRKATSYDLEALVVLFAVDHLPVASKTRYLVVSDQNYERDDTAPDPELLDVINRNERFSSKREPPVLPIAKDGEEDRIFNIVTAVDVLLETAGAVLEVRAQEVEVIARALVSCFPRVAASALDSLTVQAPDAREFSGRIWPVFVNATRACYPLFKALALPLLPSPVYTLELLARGWRCVRREALERFLPTSAGGMVKVTRDHYTKHLLGPVKTLADVSLMSEWEEKLMVRVLSEGVLPCFAGNGDSVPDRLVSCTTALAFAASGLRVFGHFKETEHGDEDKLRVTSAGLLYFAAWYVLVYACVVHTRPALKKRLIQTGSVADKHLCAALKLKRATGSSSGDYQVVDFDSREIVGALQAVFGNLLHANTIRRVAEIYVPEFLAQLPYAKKLEVIPGSIKSAIESRDVWFFKECGLQLRRHRAQFPYLGNLAQGLHSSIRGTLIGGDARPIAQAPPAPTDGAFDPWCDTLMFHGFCKPHIDEVLRVAMQPEPNDTFVDLDREVDQKAQVPSSADVPTEGSCEDGQRETEPLCAGVPWESGASAAGQNPVKAPALTNAKESGEEHGTEKTVEKEMPVPHKRQGCRRICEGLFVVSTDELGFDQTHQFLSLLEMRDENLDRTRRVSAPVIQTPCMSNIASTVYVKTRTRQSVSSFFTVPLVRFNKCKTEAMASRHAMLVEALWVLFMHYRVAAPGNAEMLSEPRTPEALAVMIHLAVKSFNLETVTSFGVCNNINALCSGACDREAEFIPTAAIVGGLFGVNLELIVNGCNYYVVNDHYRGLWAPGPVCYDGNAWQATLCGLDIPVQIPREARTANCHHVGTLCAYTRLNNLKVSRVLSDNYCGFHTVAALLGATEAKQCDRRVREILVQKTVDYMVRNIDLCSIRVYLGLNNLDTPEGLTDLLMQRDRWLSVEEITFMLAAHGKPSAVITENSYPIYKSDFAHFLIKANHYEPVMSV